MWLDRTADLFEPHTSYSDSCQSQTQRTLSGFTSQGVG